MPLFARNINNDVLISIEYVKILLDCKYGTESIIHALAGQRFGAASRVTRTILKKVKQGIPIDDAFPQATMGIEHKNLASFFLVLRAEPGTNVTRRLTELSNRIVKQTTLTVDTLIDSMKVNLNRLMMIMTAPLFIFFLALIEDALGIGDLPFQFSIPAYTNEIIIIFDVIALFIVMILLRYKD